MLGVNGSNFQRSMFKTGVPTTCSLSPPFTILQRKSFRRFLPPLNARVCPESLFNIRWVFGLFWLSHRVLPTSANVWDTYSTNINVVCALNRELQPNTCLSRSHDTLLVVRFKWFTCMLTNETCETNEIFWATLPLPHIFTRFLFFYVVAS